MIILILLFLSVFLGGGFYTFVYAAFGITEAVVLSRRIIKRKRILIPWSAFGLAMGVCCLISLLIPLWAIDRVMAWDGAVRVWTAGLFYILLLQEESGAKEKMKDLIYIIAALSVMASLVLSVIPAVRSYIFVSGRLGGPFMYPNTYALFLLIALISAISSIYKRMACHEAKWRIGMDIAAGVICIIGIILTASRGVLLVSLILLEAFFVMLFLRKRSGAVRGISAALSVLIPVVTAAALFVLFSGGAISGRLSTMWGRLLYDKDALGMILSNPWGLGYYGYYFLQGSMQSGVYSVVNVHNEYLQLMLDLGVLPGLLIIWSVLKKFFIRKDKSENRPDMAETLMFLAIAIHCFIDYDLQFLPIVMIFLILITDSDIEARGTKEISISRPASVVAVVCLSFLSLLCIRNGLSDSMYVFGYSNVALGINPDHTLALKEVMLASSDDEVISEAAERVLDHNKYDAPSYITKGREAFSAGDIQSADFYYNKSMDTAPYDISVYEEYLTIMKYALDQYREMGDKDSELFAAKQILSVEDRLRSLSDRTSDLAYKIKDKPQLEIGASYRAILDDAHRRGEGSTP